MRKGLELIIGILKIFVSPIETYYKGRRRRLDKQLAIAALDALKKGQPKQVETALRAIIADV